MTHIVEAVYQKYQGLCKFAGFLCGPNKKIMHVNPLTVISVVKAESGNAINKLLLEIRSHVLEKQQLDL